jgi:hypothetical protein
MFSSMIPNLTAAIKAAVEQSGGTFMSAEECKPPGENPHIERQE